MTAIILPPSIPSGLVTLGSVEERRQSLALLQTWCRGLQGAINESKARGHQQVTAGDSIENWEALLNACGDACIALAKSCA